MSDSQNKSTASPPSDQQHQQQQHQGQPIYAIQQPGPYTTVGAYPQYYPYPPPPTDANGHPVDPNVGNAPPGAYMMFPPPPPGMIYAYPTQQGYPAMPFAPGMPLPAALVRPKRKQVKMACTNCAAACKRCDEGRPCERCMKYGIADSCQDGVRKERKKGIKRGPYKRKGKVNSDGGYEGYTETGQPGFYPQYFYSPGIMTVGPDGQPMQADPNTPQPGVSVAVPGVSVAGVPHPYYPVHPAYQTFAPYPHGTGAPYPVMAAGPMAMAPQSQAGPSGVNMTVVNGNGAMHPPSGDTAVDPSKTTGHGKDINGGGEGEANVIPSPPSRPKKRGKANDSGNGSTGKKGKKSAAHSAEGSNGVAMMEMTNSQATSS